MNTTGVRIRAGRRPGMAITLLMLAAVLRPVKAAEIVITVTGDIVGGSGDMLHLFGAKDDIIGQPITIVFTFDDTKGKRTPIARCPGSATGIEGTGENSPGKAVVTIRGKSFTFGARKDSHSEVWREINSPCSNSQIAFEVDDNLNRGNTVISVKLYPADLEKSLTQNPDWRAPLSSSAMEQHNNRSGFAIQLPGDAGWRGDGATVSVKSITITGPGWRTLWR
jgi:hypothetical protein